MFLDVQKVYTYRQYMEKLYTTNSNEIHRDIYNALENEGFTDQIESYTMVGKCITLNFKQDVDMTYKFAEIRLLIGAVIFKFAKSHNAGCEFNRDESMLFDSFLQSDVSFDQYIVGKSITIQL